MIDDPAEVTQLLQQMEAQLPIPAQLTKALRDALRQQGLKIPATRQVHIDKVFYSGDEGGIVCGLTFPGQKGNAVVVSLTHLRVVGSHPLATAIASYQRERTRKLAHGR
jgi:hypothetical protein